MKKYLLLLTFILAQMAFYAYGQDSNYISNVKSSNPNNIDIVNFYNSNLLHQQSMRIQVTNEVYVTMHPLPLNVGEIIDSYHSSFYDEIIEKQESLPAKSFTKGNWGYSTNGLQVSLRLTKSIYANGEKIPAIVLVRNVTNFYVNFAPSHFGFGDDPVPLMVTAHDGQLMERMKSGPIVSQGGATLPPLRQLKCQEFISAYNLTNGRYFVHASVKMPLQIEENGKPKAIWCEIDSANVPFEIKN